MTPNDERTGIDLLARTIDEVASSIPLRPSPLPVQEGLEAAGPPGLEAPSSRRRWLWPAALAAAAVAAVLAYPTYLGLVELPTTQQELRHHVERSQSPIQVRLLSFPRPAEVVRGGSEGAPQATLIALEPEASIVLLFELPPEILDAVDNRTAETFVIRLAPDGETTQGRSWTVPGTELRQLVSASEGVPLLLRPEDLGPGRTRASVSRRRGSGEEELTSLVFEIVDAGAPTGSP